MNEGHRCPHCDALLDAATLVAGECGCRWRRGDTVMNPRTGFIFAAVGDGSGGLLWLELSPTADHAQPNPPADAVLLVRWVDGKPLPVTDTTGGDLYAVKTA